MSITCAPWSDISSQPKIRLLPHVLVIPLIGRQVDKHRMELADVAVAHDLAAIAHGIARTLMRTGLEHRARLLHGIAKRLALADGIGQRVVAENMRARGGETGVATTTAIALIYCKIRARCIRLPTSRRLR